MGEVVIPDILVKPLRHQGERGRLHADNACPGDGNLLQPGIPEGHGISGFMVNDSRVRGSAAGDDGVGLVAVDDGRAGVEGRFKQVAPAANLSDAGQVRPDIPSAVNDLMSG